MSILDSINEFALLLARERHGVDEIVIDSASWHDFLGEVARLPAFINMTLRGIEDAGPITIPSPAGPIRISRGQR